MENLKKITADDIITFKRAFETGYGLLPMKSRQRITPLTPMSLNSLQTHEIIDTVDRGALSIAKRHMPLD